MPKLDTPIHLEMYERGKARRRLSHRIKNAIRALMAEDHIYGLEWGDPDVCPPLRYIRGHFLLPYISSETTLIEIGPGGGRWTRYMLGAKRIYAVDYHQDLLDELKSKINSERISYVKNNGDDFPNIPDRSIDFIFSFGTFVHLDVDIIDRYLSNMKNILKQNANVVLQYSDKSKPLGRSSRGFSNNSPTRMRKLIRSHGYCIFEEDLKTMWHSSLVRFGLPNRST